MDIARAPKKKTGRYIMIGAGVVVLAVATYFVSGLKPAAPTVDMAVVIQDSVRRGDLTIEVRGPGTLVPEQIQFVPAQTTARVDNLDVVSGQKVEAGDVLLHMSSPDAEIQTMQADQALSQARASLITLRSDLKNAILAQQSAVASTNTQYIAAKQNAEAADTLARQKLAAPFDVNNAHALAAQLTIQLANEKQRLLNMQQADDSQVAAAVANVEQLQRIAEFNHTRLQSLVVRAPAAGVVQGLDLQPGQFVTEGTTMLKVVQPGKLKAVLRISESEAKDVAIGQSAVIDTRSNGSNGLIQGHVSRKDPSATNGTVTVDVSLEGALPPGAVPDLSVDGTIKIAQLKNVLYTGRPAYGSASGKVGLFKQVEGGSAAVRVPVELGRSSVTTVEILSGLNVGDIVILSDMSQYDNVERVRLK